MRPLSNDRTTRPLHLADVRRPRIRHAGRLALAASLLTLVIGAVGIVTRAGSGAVTSGWYVATTPGTGADDILLGSSCANATQCWEAGVSMENIGSGSGSTFAPLVETWNGTTWTLAPTPPVPDGHGGGLFDVSCVNGSDCWAVGAVLGANGDGNPSGTLIENWNGFAWSVVPSPTPTGPGVVGALLQGVSCSTASSCVAVGESTDSTGENLARSDPAVERRDLEHRPRSGHRSGLRPVDERHLPGGRRLLGGGQRRPRAAEPELPSHLSGECPR